MYYEYICMYYLIANQTNERQLTASIHVWCVFSPHIRKINTSEMLNFTDTDRQLHPQCLTSLIQTDNCTPQCLTSLIQTDNCTPQCLTSLIQTDNCTPQCLTSLIQTDNCTPQCIFLLKTIRLYIQNITEQSGIECLFNLI